MKDLIDVYIKDCINQPLHMERNTYSCPTLGKGYYIRFFAEGESGLTFNDKDELVGLWGIEKGKNL